MLKKLLPKKFGIFKDYKTSYINIIQRDCTTLSDIAAKNKKIELSILKYRPDPENITSDYIGAPDKISNLRPVIRAILPDETPLQKTLRTKQNEAEKWNFDFWTRHNKRFYDEKAEFIAVYKNAGYDEISADKMSKFYKSFLDKNKKLHFYYNLSWYFKNLEILLLSAQNNIVNFISRGTKKVFKNKIEN